MGNTGGSSNVWQRSNIIVFTTQYSGASRINTYLQKESTSKYIKFKNWFSHLLTYIKSFVLKLIAFLLLQQ